MATTGNEIMVIECDSNGNAVKAGTAIVTAMA
uniref:S-layer protein n=1 Tax=Siphoviridae sp. ctnNB1 TaxID=2825660 RepID=A0A8S5UVH3_9CAUD|nr:MAG TPA: S-layer protein [Siphoviridae sp. ctnNB1]